MFESERDLPSCFDVSTLLEHYGPHPKLQTVFLRWETYRAGTSYELQRGPDGNWTARYNLITSEENHDLERCTDPPPDIGT